MKNQGFLKRLLNAFCGLKYAWLGERSFRTQIAIGIAVGLFFTWWGLTAIWWGLVTIAITLVLGAELVNSCIEALIDHLYPQYHPAIGKVKDMAAGMVLVTTLAALVIGVLAILENPTG